ncbi:MAG: hsp70 family protein [Deltaproteobacteria bacterium]|nr:hsp70 family protein [Deltaproteobacteria bacterium]
MSMPESRYIIGIDLGTTNSALSYVDLSLVDQSKPAIEIFKIPQISAPGEVSRLNLLPSFLYLPGEHDLPREGITLPWKWDQRGFVGVFAREQGARVPMRMVSSAKSWLCHGRVDRNAPILPWGAEENLPRVSPVEATAAYLRHLREAWNHAGGRPEEEFLENQTVVITVPASFDEVARDLTIQASDMAGLRNVTLLEEPLAAFYTWLHSHEEDWDSHIRPGELVLVCDVGGGTTDFTLIALKDSDDHPAFERIAVGDHLILGGDNMDLALARHVEARLHGDRQRTLKLSVWKELCHQCRKAKEEILGEGVPSRRITLVGQGRRLIADTVYAELDRREVEEIVLERFFPLVEPGEDLEEEAGEGISDLGLPYAQDPAITRQMVRFLERHGEDIEKKLGRNSPLPDLILFNGGTLKPAGIRERIQKALCIRFGKGDDNRPGVLENPDLDLAVALGASYYGLVRRGLGVKVSSGSPRAYFLGVGRAEDPEAGSSASKMALCLVERGMEEGRIIRLPERSFLVRANQPVTFDLYSSSYRTGDRAGDLIPVDESLTRLPPLRTVIRFGKKGKRTELPVSIEANFTEVGTLAIWCRSTRTEHGWRLQFQLRKGESSPPLPEQQVFEEALVERALSKIREVFSRGADAGPPGRLVPELVELLDRAKEKWPISFVRRAADELIDRSPARKISPDHEGRWLNLAGFCLRPGFGDALDEHRIKKVWKLYHEGPVHGRAVQVRCEWWVFWRRVCAGLNTNQQQRLFLEISSRLRPRKGKGKKLSPQEYLECWMALANLERIPPAEKAKYGKILLEELHPKGSRPQYWWALSRLGARDPLYGPLDRVVPAGEVSGWIEEILSKEWRNPRPVAAALIRLARCTGDRRRDLEPSLRERIGSWLNNIGWDPAKVRAIEEVQPRDAREESAAFGEDLPLGIVLLGREQEGGESAPRAPQS